MNKQEYDNGYEAAIQALKDVINGKQNGDQTGNSGQDNQGMESPQDAVNNGPEDNKKKAQQNQGKGGSSSSSSSSSSGSGSGRGSGSQGVVQPEDCMGPDSLNEVPGTPGGMIDRKTGDQIAKSEGQDENAGSESGIENEWKDAALKAAGKLNGSNKKGNGPGSLKSKIETLYKTSKDWKKELRKVVGYSISPEDKRQAYANKNVLVSQDRIARTDKDKYDNMDYMMAWVDSSGSMSDEQLRMCLSEVYAVALAKKPIKLIIIQCDTKIQDIKEYTNLNQLKKDMIHATVKGRGGTELKPCWDLMKNDKKYRRPADLIMIFTDGYLDQYKRDPRHMKNLCWVLIDNPSFQIQYKDINTKAVYINSKDVK